MNAQNKVNRMKEIFESSEMAQKFLDVGPEKLNEYTKELSEIRFDSQLNNCIRENNIPRYIELMKVGLEHHPLKEDALFKEAWQLASDPEVIAVAWQEERQKAS